MLFSQKAGGASRESVQKRTFFKGPGKNLKKNKKSIDTEGKVCYTISCRHERRQIGRIAQLGEHLPYKQGVTGSSPVVPTNFGPVVQLVRTPACHAGGRGFEPHPGRQMFASVAQSVEQRTENPRVDGSIPSGGTTYANVAHLVERHLAKVEVASSSLVIRSKQRDAYCVSLEHINKITVAP